MNSSQPHIARSAQYATSLPAHLPMLSGSSTMVSGCSLSSREATSRAWRWRTVWKGLATSVSKLGSPAPGGTEEAGVGVDGWFDVQGRHHHQLQTSVRGACSVGGYPFAKEAWAQQGGLGFGL